MRKAVVRRDATDILLKFLNRRFNSLEVGDHDVEIQGGEGVDVGSVTIGVARWYFKVLHICYRVSDVRF